MSSTLFYFFLKNSPSYRFMFIIRSHSIKAVHRHNKPIILWRFARLKADLQLIFSHNPSDEVLCRPKSQANKPAITINPYLQATINLLNYNYAFVYMLHQCLPKTTVLVLLCVMITTITIGATTMSSPFRNHRFIKYYYSSTLFKFHPERFSDADLYALAVTPLFSKRQQNCWRQWRLIVPTLKETLHHL